MSWCDLPERINRWVGDLCKELLEVFVDDRLELRQACKRSVIAHGAERFLLLLDHRKEKHLYRFGGVAVQ